MKRIVYFILLFCTISFAQDYRRLLFMEDDAPFTPKNVTNLFAWYDFTDASSMTVDGSNLVSSVTDKSGLGNTLSQGTGSKQPLFNAVTGVTFDGVNDRLTTGALTLNQPCTIFLVLNQITWVDTKFVFGGAIQTIRLYQRIASGGLRMLAGGTSLDNPTGTTGVYQIVTSVWNGASSTSQVNDLTTASGQNIGSANFSLFTIGGQSDDGNFTNIAVKAIIAYSKVLSAAEIAQVKSYLKSKYGVTY